MPLTERALAEIERRWLEIFHCLEAGTDVPPTMRLRAEGMMETLVLLGICDRQELQQRLAVTYERSFRTALPAHWIELFPFPQIPGFGVRAPVFPSTRD